MSDTGGSSPVIHPARADEVERAVAIWLASNDARAGRPATSAATEAMVRGWMALPDATLLVADDGGEVTGMALALAGRDPLGHGPVLPGVADVALLFVAPGRWGQGIGRALLDATLDRVRAGGYARVRVNTHASNERALRLYASRGFQPTGRTFTNDLGETIVESDRSV